MKTKIYIPVSVEDELPPNEDYYFVFTEGREQYIDDNNQIQIGEFSTGKYCRFNITFEGKYFVNLEIGEEATHWLKEVELTLPSDKEIEIAQLESEKSKQPKHFMTDENKSWHYTGFMDCIKYLREQITKQLKIK